MWVLRQTVTSTAGWSGLGFRYSFARRLPRGATSDCGYAFDEEHGFGFRILGMSAVFSAITLDGALPLDRFDIQIESLPLGDYLYRAEVCLDGLLGLIKRYRLPAEAWP